MPGDTRIVMIYVDKPEKPEPKTELISRLVSEAPFFLHYLLELEIPKAASRLRIPIIETNEKKEQQNANRNDLEIFIAEKCYPIEGQTVTFQEFINSFLEWLPPVKKFEWSTQRIGRIFPKQFPKGRYPGTNIVHIGNLSFSEFTKELKKIEPGRKWIQVRDRIYLEGSLFDETK
jgi:hypothetical protein